MELAKNAADIASKAIDFDKRNCIDAAIYFYTEASRLLYQASQQLEGSKCEELLKKAKEYENRADVIRKPCNYSIYVIMLIKKYTLYEKWLDENAYL